ncbi:extracellular electron transfer flavoprotein PplA, partial [Enterococcus faecalis]
SRERKKTTESSPPAKKVGGGDLKDGSFKLEEKNEKNGYPAVFEMTVKDGKITGSKYDNINDDDKSKTEDTKYEESIKA